MAKAHSESGNDVIERFQYQLIQCTDPNNNTPLSEASAGGESMGVVKGGFFICPHRLC